MEGPRYPLSDGQIRRLVGDLFRWPRGHGCPAYLTPKVRGRLTSVPTLPTLPKLPTFVRGPRSAVRDEPEELEATRRSDQQSAPESSQTQVAPKRTAGLRTADPGRWQCWQCWQCWQWASAAPSFVPER